jgi:hypothetical protein
MAQPNQTLPWNKFKANKAGSLAILPYLFAPSLSFCYYTQIDRKQTAGFEIRVLEKDGRLIATCQALAYHTGKPIPFL